MLVNAAVLQAPARTAAARAACPREPAPPQSPEYSPTLSNRARRPFGAIAAVGFGLPAYLLCLVPVLQLLVIPAAVVGGTLLAHRVLPAARRS